MESVKWVNSTKWVLINILMIVLFQLCVISEQGFSATYYQIQSGLRTLPQSGSVEAQFFYNEKLWSRSENEPKWKYGLWRLGVFTAIHGQLGLRVDVYPISIWQIQIQRSLTSRFYDTKTVDCLVVECRGVLQRGTFKTSLALGYGDYFLIPSYSITNLELSSAKKNFSSEEDNIVADQNGDQAVTMQLAIGLKQKDQKWVFLNKDTRMVNTRDSNSSKYLIWSQSKENDLNYFVGAGTFKSSYLSSSLSVIMGISWTAGENLSFF